MTPLPTATQQSTSDWPPARRVGPASSLRELHGWNAMVAGSGAIVVLVVLVTVIGWLASLRSHTTTYAVAAVSQVDLQVASGQAVVVGSNSPVVEVKWTDHYAFGHAAREQRWLADGVLHITSRCPKIVVGSCSASYQVTVPEAVTVRVQTGSGDVRMTGFDGNAVVETGSGNVDVEAYCGFRLSARSQSGNLYVATACTPQSLRLRSGRGDVVALVPPGRYRLGASSGERRVQVKGLVSDPTAPFAITADSSGGTVTVEGGL